MQMENAGLWTNSVACRIQTGIPSDFLKRYDRYTLTYRLRYLLVPPFR